MSRRYGVLRHGEYGTYTRNRWRVEDNINRDNEIEAYKQRSHSKTPAELLAEEAAEQERERQTPLR